MRDSPWKDYSRDGLRPFTHCNIEQFLLVLKSRAGKGAGECAQAASEGTKP